VRGKSRATKVLRAVVAVYALASVCFALASIYIFADRRSPLTVAWLYLADNRGAMASSIARFRSPTSR
jgi:hypothetical protein